MKFSILAAALSGLAVTPAMADCFDVIGCTDSQKFRKSDLREMSCQLLWDVRNRIYKENGYCFKTDAAIEYFGNDGCTVHNQASVRLNHYERYNVGVIKSVEAEKGC